MGFSLIAYYTAAANTGLAALPTITDTSINTQGSAGIAYAMPTKFPYILGGAILSAHAARAEIYAPSLLKQGPIYIEPACTAADWVHRPPWTNLSDSPAYVTPGDGLILYMDRLSTTEASYGLLWIGDGPIQPVRSVGGPNGGGIIPFEVTASITAVAGAWTAGQLSFTNQPEAGTYRCVGMQAHFNGGKAARLIPPTGGVQIRPGVLASSDATKQMPEQFRIGRFGAFLDFDSETPPQVEILGSAATTSQRFVLDLIKIASP